MHNFSLFYYMIIEPICCKKNISNMNNNNGIICGYFQWLDEVESVHLQTMGNLDHDLEAID